MSLDYEIVERLVVDAEKQTELQKWVLETTARRFANLARGVEIRKRDCYSGYDAQIRNITAQIDGIPYQFTDNETGERYQEMILALECGKHVEVTAAYCVVDGCEEVPSELEIDGWDITPEEMIYDLCKKINYNADEMEGIYLACWSADDCDDYRGVLEAYGWRNGEKFFGYVPRRPIDTIPEGAWMTQTTIIAYDSDFKPSDPEYKNAHLPEIREVCHELADFVQTDEVYEDETGIEVLIAVDRVTLDTPEKVKHFMDLSAKLWQLSKGDANLDINLDDVSGTSLRILGMEMNPDGTYQLYLREA